jgi:hypothetical protein
VAAAAQKFYFEGEPKIFRTSTKTPAAIAARTATDNALLPKVDGGGGGGNIGRVFSKLSSVTYCPCVGATCGIGAVD